MLRFQQIKYNIIRYILTNPAIGFKSKLKDNNKTGNFLYKLVNIVTDREAWPLPVPTSHARSWHGVFDAMNSKSWIG